MFIFIPLQSTYHLHRAREYTFGAQKPKIIRKRKKYGDKRYIYCDTRKSSMWVLPATYGNSFRMEGRELKKVVWATGCLDWCAVDDRAVPVLYMVLQASRMQGVSRWRPVEDHLHIRPL